MDRLVLRKGLCRPVSTALPGQGSRRSVDRLVLRQGPRRLVSVLVHGVGSRGPTTRVVVVGEGPRGLSQVPQVGADGRGATGVAGWDPVRSPVCLGRCRGACARPLLVSPPWYGPSDTPGPIRPRRLPWVAGKVYVATQDPSVASVCTGR